MVYESVKTIMLSMAFSLFYWKTVFSVFFDSGRKVFVAVFKIITNIDSNKMIYKLARDKRGEMEEEKGEGRGEEKEKRLGRKGQLRFLLMAVINTSNKNGIPSTVGFISGICP